MVIFTLEKAMESQTENTEIALSVTSALGGGGWAATRPGRFTHRERPGTHYVVGWMGPRTGLDRFKK
jgi:hypothetical protein